MHPTTGPEQGGSGITDPPGLGIGLEQLPRTGVQGHRPCLQLPSRPRCNAQANSNYQRLHHIAHGVRGPNQSCLNWNVNTRKLLIGLWICTQLQASDRPARHLKPVGPEDRGIALFGRATYVLIAQARLVAGLTTPWLGQRIIPLTYNCPTGTACSITWLCPAQPSMGDLLSRSRLTT